MRCWTFLTSRRPRCWLTFQTSLLTALAWAWTSPRCAFHLLGLVGLSAVPVVGRFCWLRYLPLEGFQALAPATA
jgi:hypothetical protein